MWFEDNVLHFCDQNNVEFSIRYGELVCIRHGANSTAEPIWMDNNGLLEPFSRKYFPTGFVEHISGRRHLLLPVSGLKCRNDDKVEDAWQNCSDIDQVVERDSLDKLSISWRQNRWYCKLVLDRRQDDGIWEIIHAESCLRDGDNLSAGVVINCDEKTWLWFYSKQGNGRSTWWKCPWQIIEKLEVHIKESRRRIREGELVREVDDQSIVNYEEETGELVREVEDQAAVTYVKEKGGSARRYLCWICGNRPFNARKQLVDHIEGAGGGGKSHLKIRKRWIEKGQPMREDWLAILEQEKADDRHEQVNQTMNQCENAADNGEPQKKTEDNGDPEKQAAIVSEVSSATMDNDVATSCHFDNAKWSDEKNGAMPMRRIWNVAVATQNGVMYSPEWLAPSQWQQYPTSWLVPLLDYRSAPSSSRHWHDDVRNASHSGNFDAMSSGCDDIVQPDCNADRSMGFWDDFSVWQYQ